MVVMLLNFTFKNFRSYRDEVCLSMEATGLSSFKESLILQGNSKFLPGVAIFGKNGGGKSTVIRALWLATRFITNAQRTQHENTSIPVTPFLLNDYSRNEPTSFEFEYISYGIRYRYGFSATKENIVSEYLYHAPKNQYACVFSREGQTFYFPTNAQKRRKEMISEAVAANQLFFSVACTMNEESCIAAMKWFREGILFSRDFVDIPSQLIENAGNSKLLQAIAEYAKAADVGIENMTFDVTNTNTPLDDPMNLPQDMPEELRNAIKQFMTALGSGMNQSELQLQRSEIKVESLHNGQNQDGSYNTFPLQLSDESDGTRRLMTLAPALDRVLTTGGVLVVDELETEMHPLLVRMIVSKFQNATTNPQHAQLVFTTHNTDFLRADLLRKDQFYFADKDRKTGVSTLYSIAEFSTSTNENIQKGYLYGKYGAIPDVTIEEVE